jgi:hypothetical protein
MYALANLARVPLIDEEFVLIMLGWLGIKHPEAAGTMYSSTNEASI